MKSKIDKQPLARYTGQRCEIDVAGDALLIGQNFSSTKYGCDSYGFVDDITENPCDLSSPTAGHDDLDHRIDRKPVKLERM